MFNRLFNLVSLQIGDRFDLNEKKPIMPILFKIAGFILIGAITIGLFYIMEKVIYLKPTNSMVLFIIFISQVITFVANSMELTESLYGSKDNQILLSLPAKHYEIYISKLTVFYILELLSNIMFLLPILFGYGIYTKQGIGFILLSILISLFLPLVSVLLGAIISIPLSLIKKLLKKVSILYVFIFAGLLIFLFIVSAKQVKRIPNPLRFMALYDYIVKMILNFIDSANKYSIFYRWFSNIIFTIKTFKNILLVLALIIALVLLNVFLSWPLFFKLASNSSESAVEKKHEGINKESKNTFMAFYKKELLISIRTFGSVIENYSMVIFMPLILYIINGLFNSFDLSIFGKNIIFGFNIIAGLLMLTSSNSRSATSLSEEGSEFILLKTSPVDTKLIAWAKILNNTIISILIILESGIILGVMKVFTFKDLIFILLTYIIINFGHILWSFQFDLRNPQIKDVALTGTISNKTNITKSISIGVVISILFGALGIVLSYVGLLWVFFILVVLFSIWRYLVFDSNLKSYFYDIEL